ncbi:MAG: FAD-binding oxidoreductase [Planctomycetota bacterium]
MLQAVGDPPAESQVGLRSTLATQGYFLACQARPQADLELRSAAGPEPVEARLVERCDVSTDVVRLMIVPSQPLGHRPGQYLDILLPSREPRSYSIASLPAEEPLELHVRRVPAGVVSNWLHAAPVGQPLQVRGSFGQCFYSDEERDRRLLLVGAGTGLAPLLGILRDALGRGHQGAIDLVHGALEPARLYLRDEQSALERAWPQLRVHHCVLRNATRSEHEGALDDVAIRLAGPLEESRVFLCGDDAIVRKLQRSLFLAGLPSNPILADPIAPAGR